MRTPTRHLLVVALLAATAAVIAGCGGDDAGTTVAPVDPATSSTGTPVANTGTATDPNAAVATAVGGLPQGDGNDVRLLGEAVGGDAFGLSQPVSTDGLMPDEEEDSTSPDTSTSFTSTPTTTTAPTCTVNNTGKIVDWQRIKLKVNNTIYWLSEDLAPSYFPSPEDYFFLDTDSVEVDGATISLTAGVFADAAATFELGLGQTVTIVKTDTSETFRLTLQAIGGYNAKWIKYERTCT